jgi:cation diffusion facilitator CzcD-associated flavoprotein CzcO
VTTTRTDTQVVIVGAGQAGLAVAYYLRRFELVLGVDFIVFDRGPTTGGAWQHRWDALKLGSAHHVNDLPGMSELGISFETADRSLPAKDIVAGYYRRYEQHFGLDVQRPVTVTSVFDRGADLIVQHTAGETGTRVVVNASGTWGAPFIPYYPGMNRFSGRHVHTSSYLSAEEFAGQSVVVVGGGTSAIGFILELEHVASQVAWATRRPVDFRDESELTMEGGVARGVLVERPMFTAIERDGVRWPDGTFTQADAIIWATGFRPELRHLSPLRLREKAGGLTVASGASWQDPRIFLAGYGPQASTIGANRAGRVIARQIMAQL